MTPNIKVLAWGPNSYATLWNMYFINGYTFHTNTWSGGNKTINYEVHVKCVKEDDKMTSLESSNIFMNYNILV